MSIAQDILDRKIEEYEGQPHTPTLVKINGIDLKNSLITYVLRFRHDDRRVIQEYLPEVITEIRGSIGGQSAAREES